MPKKSRTGSLTQLRKKASIAAFEKRMPETFSVSRELPIGPSAAHF